VAEPLTTRHHLRLSSSTESSQCWSRAAAGSAHFRKSQTDIRRRLLLPLPIRESSSTSGFARL